MHKLDTRSHYLLGISIVITFLVLTYIPTPVTRAQDNPVKPSSNNNESTKSLPLDLQYALSTTQGHDDNAYYIAPINGDYQAKNPAQQLDITFQSDTVHIVSGDYAWSLQLTGYRSPDQIGPVESATRVSSDNRIEYQYGSLTEWYVNGPFGLQQGFTLTKAPLGQGENLALEMELGGDLQASVNDAKDALSLTSKDGKLKLQYTGLNAYDAKGKTLPAYISINDSQLTLHVNARGAVYPITVDPVVQQQKLTANDYINPAKPDGSYGHQFGYSVVLSGDTALVGAPYADSAVGNDSGAAYVFTRSGNTWSPQAKLTANDPSASDYFGTSVALSGDVALISAPNDDNNAGSDAGSAYIFTRSGTNWSQQQKLTANDAASSDFFGWSVAISGDNALISARNIATVYVFTNANNTWSQQQKLISDSPNSGGFGNALALSSDTALISASGEPFGSNNYASGVYVFVRSGNTWSKQTKFTANDTTSYNSDGFGASLAISGDTAIISARAWASYVGAAYIFTRSGTSWSQQQKLTANDGAPNDNFGWSVAVSGDTALIGSLYDGDAGNSSGSAYLFTRSGGSWNQQIKLIGSDTVASNFFGYAVALSGDTALIGAMQNNTSGSVYVYNNTGSTWSQTTKLRPVTLNQPDADAYNGFGHSAALSEDGATAIIGAPSNDNGVGAAYIFVYSGTSWLFQAKLTPNNGSSNIAFGNSVALLGDTAFIGTSANFTTPGAVYVFTRSGAIWSQQQKLTANDGVPYDNFGSSFSLSGDTAIVGATSGNNPGGAAYVFTRSGNTWSQQQKLTANDSYSGAQFGSSISLQDNTVLIGAMYDSNSGNSPRLGAAYVFTRSGNIWSQQQKLVADNGAENDMFGKNVALSGDSALIGASGNSNHYGAAYVFTHSGNNWSQQQKLTADDSAQNYFGFSISLSGDTALVGALNANNFSGAAYVFTRSGTNWSQQQKFASDDLAQSDQFGYAVYLVGNKALIGARNDSFGGLASPGSAYIFSLSFNQPPVLDPIGNQTLDEGQTLNLSLTATDPENSTLSFSATGAPAFVNLTDNGDGTAALEINPTFTSAGSYPITVTVSDGAMTDSETFNVVVNKVNITPSANAGSDQILTDANNNGSEMVTLDASASIDSDGSITTYSWSENGNPIASGVGPTVSLSTGTHILTLTVTDNLNGQNTDTVTIQILAVTSGDCNGDQLVNAGDLSALTLEIFDGDGNVSTGAIGGTFAGTAKGCDSNADTSIDAGDISCTTLIIFDPEAVCDTP